MRNCLVGKVNPAKLAYIRILIVNGKEYDTQETQYPEQQSCYNYVKKGHKCIVE